LVTGAIAAVPVLVSAGQAIDAGWTPSSDDGVIALRAFDVLSSHPPLLGQYSQTSPLLGETIYSLGPLLYWVLAVPARIGGTAMVVTMAALSAASIVGSVVIAERRGGRAFAAITSIALVVAYRSVPVEVPYEVWNCWAGLYPMILLLFVAWTVGCGDHRLLPLMVVLASFVAQCHLTYVLPALAVVAVAIAGLRRAPRPWVVAAVVAFAVCWSAPVVDQVGHRPGNLVRAYQLATGDHTRVGAETGWYSTVRAIGVPPWWAKRSRTPAERVLETVRRPPVVTTLSALLVLGALTAALVVAHRRRRREALVTAALGLVVCASIGLVAASAPGGLLGLAASGYALTWMSPAGMFAGLAAAWSVWHLWRPAWRWGDLEAPPARVAALVAVAAASAAITDRSDEQADRLPPGLKDYELIRATAQRVAADLAGSRGVRIDVPRSVHNSLTYQSAIAYELRGEGIPFSVPARLVKEMGGSYAADEVRAEDVIRIADGNAPIGAGERVLVRRPDVTVTRSVR
jgi:hypothetical protein